MALTLEELEAAIRQHPCADSPDVRAVLDPVKSPWDEKEYDRRRKAEQRAKEREIFIPAPKDIELRVRCLASPELLLETYFPDTYDEPFTEDRSDMLASIVWAAKYGGDQAIAGSRGEGKTTLAMDGGFYLMLANLSTFPVVIGKNQDGSSDELKALREKIVDSERFVEDFPEIAIPMVMAGPGVSGPRQTVAGKYIKLYMGAKYFALPTISRSQLPHWPEGVQPVSNGQIMGSLGMNGKIRGEKFRGHRPTLAIIDDIEDATAAKSDHLIELNEKKIEEDIGGLGRSARRIARVMLCTTQNRKCIAYKYTDPKQKESWRGKRYRKMKKPPGRMDLVEEYIAMRKGRSSDDPDAREAHRFWKSKQTLIESDCEISNPRSFNGDMHADGEPLEWSAIQAYYNRVADMGEKAVATEIDNDPPETVGPQGLGLTAGLVESRNSGLSRLQLPANATSLTAAIDLGKYACHWVVVAWWKGAGGCVVDYGIAEVCGTERINSGDKAADMVASEPHIYRALLAWRDQLLQKQFVDAAGALRKVDCVFVDSGTYTNAAYEFVRQVGGVFHCAKGLGRYRPKTKSTETVRAGDNMHAAYQDSERLWLFELNTDYWKNWIHERFLTPTFDEDNMLRRGALSIYQPQGNKKHSSIAQHVVAEELVTEFKEGKGANTFWLVKNDNNHWLDALYYAACAARFTGVHLLSESEVPNEPRAIEVKPKRQRKQHGRTPGANWMKRVRRR